MSDEIKEDMDLGGGDEGAAPASPDPFADVPADGGAPEVEEAPGALGGDGATLEELGEEEPLGEEEAPINGGAEEEGGELPGAPVDPLASDEPPAPAAEEPAPAEGPPAEPEPTPEPKPEAEKSEPKAASKSGGKKGTAERTYVVLTRNGEGHWEEVIDGGVKAANGESAMRQAYSELVEEDSDDALTLAVIPAHYWNPKTVQSKVKRDRAIEIV